MKVEPSPPSSALLLCAPPPEPAHDPVAAAHGAGLPAFGSPRYRQCRGPPHARLPVGVRVLALSLPPNCRLCRLQLRVLLLPRFA